MTVETYEDDEETVSTRPASQQRNAMRGEEAEARCCTAPAATYHSKPAEDPQIILKRWVLETMQLGGHRSKT